MNKVICFMFRTLLVALAIIALLLVIGMITGAIIPGAGIVYLVLSLIAMLCIANEIDDIEWSSVTKWI